MSATEQQLGELIATVREIKKNTDKIPDLSVAVAIHAEKISKMEPKVEAHEATAQRAFGISAVTGLVGGILTAMAGRIFGG